MDEFTLKDFEAEWRTARQRMLTLKFDKKLISMTGLYIWKGGYITEFTSESYDVEF